EADPFGDARHLGAGAAEPGPRPGGAPESRRTGEQPEKAADRGDDAGDEADTGIEDDTEHEGGAEGPGKGEHDDPGPRSPRRDLEEVVVQCRYSSGTGWGGGGPM